MKRLHTLTIAVAVALAGCHRRAATVSIAPTPEPATAAAAEPEPIAPESSRDGERPQTPVAPFPYDAHEVVYTNTVSGLPLAGTLTIPHGGDRYPSVVLISGSGPQDRDSTVFGHKPFWVLADLLSRRGIAVLRVDDRGVGGSGRGEPDVTTLDFAGDVAAGVEFLRRRPELDPERIGLVGHSEGGAIAPIVAAEDPRIAAIVLLAGPGVRGDELLAAQARAVLQARGASESMIDAAVNQQERVLAAVAQAPDLDSARSAVLAIAGIQTEAARALVDKQVVPWLVYFVKHDPAPILQRVRCPVLALGGALDVQVVSSQNLPAISEALRLGDNQDATVTELAGLNHLLQPAKTGGPEEYAAIATTLDPVALATIAQWLGARL